MEADGAEDPLLVFPKATSGLNNIHNLTLSSLSSDIDNNNRNTNNNCSSSSSSNAFPNLESQSNNKSVRQPSADLGQILSQGQISFMQLEYSKLLGKGNSGTGKEQCFLVGPEEWFFLLRLIDMFRFPEVVQLSCVFVFLNVNV